MRHNGKEVRGGRGNHRQLQVEGHISGGTGNGGYSSQRYAESMHPKLQEYLDDMTPAKAREALNEQRELIYGDHE